MKLNKNGLTTIELLISFVLLAIIVASAYGTVESYKNKESIEEYKNKIYTYKNLLTREIQGDLIKKGLIDATVQRTAVNASDPSNVIPEKYTLNLFFRDGSSSILEVSRIVADDYGASATASSSCPSGKNDKYVISYGVLGNMFDYPLPNLGEGKNDEGCTIYDLRISSVDINNNNQILTIRINFYHPDFGTRYGINIICPINFSR